MPHRLFDHHRIRCPKLGSDVDFGYCRQLSDGLPCERAIRCFEPCFPVEAFFRQVLREQTFERCFCKPVADRYGALLQVVHDVKGGDNPPKH